MGRYRAGLETRARIVDGVRRLLAEGGVEAATVKAICDSAGIGAGSFYNLFGSKEEAILEVVTEAITAVDPDPSRAGRESVADLVHAYVEFVSGAAQLACIYLQLAVCGSLTDAGLARRVLRHHDRRVDRLTAAMRRQDGGVPDELARRRAELLLATLNGLALHWLLDPSFDLAAYAEELLERHARP